ncbi:MAG TPA: response regulator [Aggregatilineales bacterium]|nr:response regulator [Aggregatilineales bacterium]
MGNGSILLIDDDLDQLSILGSMLGNLPYPLETALNGQRALEMLQEEVPALVITDLVMPDISGSEIIRTIREDPRLANTRIIIITSLMKYVSDEDRQLADLVIIKPAKKNELVGAVHQLLG